MRWSWASDSFTPATSSDPGHAEFGRGHGHDLAGSTPIIRCAGCAGRSSTARKRSGASARAMIPTSRRAKATTSTVSRTARHASSLYPTSRPPEPRQRVSVLAHDRPRAGALALRIDDPARSGTLQSGAQCALLHASRRRQRPAIWRGEEVKIVSRRGYMRTRIETHVSGNGAPRHAGRCSRWAILTSPSKTLSLGFLTIGGFLAGIVFWGGFNTALEATNTEKFCVGCHEMRENVFQELKSTIHYSNRSGVRATCPDCHVPHDWTHKIGRKIQASKEVWGKIFGSISTREKFVDMRFESRRTNGSDSKPTTRSNAAIVTAPSRWTYPSRASARPMPTSDHCSPARRPASIATRGSPIGCRKVPTILGYRRMTRRAMSSRRYAASSMSGGNSMDASTRCARRRRMPDRLGAMG